MRKQQPITIYLPDEVHRALEGLAKEQKRPVNAVAKDLLIGAALPVRSKAMRHMSDGAFMRLALQHIAAGLDAMILRSGDHELWDEVYANRANIFGWPPDYDGPHAS